VLIFSQPAAGPTRALLGGSLLVFLPAAFLAGILSFLSPCTLPILPAYFAFTFQARRGNVVAMTVSFFLGLATTLTLLGASASALSLLLLRNLQQLTLIGGVVIIGLGVLSLFGRGFAGPQIQEVPARSAFGSYLYGATFALGWTACVGPILGGIFTLLATQGVAVLQGALLSFVYALGLGLPLILISAFFSRLGQGSRFWQILRGRELTFHLGERALSLHTTNVLSGLLLISMGLLLASGQLTSLTEVAAGSDLSLWVIEMEERLRALLSTR
jgi:cytochrome c-type biogenesis protein